MRRSTSKTSFKRGVPTEEEEEEQEKEKEKAKEKEKEKRRESLRKRQT